MISQRIFIQCTSELVRLKALDPDFAFLHFTSIYEHLPSTCAKLKIHCGIKNHQYFTKSISIRKCSYIARRLLYMLVSCKNTLYESRAFKRTNSEWFWINTNWYSSFWSLVNFANFKVFSTPRHQVKCSLRCKKA